ncbi:MAG TPA: hypothetical protein VMX55_08735 [candidate division Zixibacteria bacterium]|nr:hypothetical protein [candidate division Zixibacteria bacterium]
MSVRKNIFCEINYNISAKTFTWAKELDEIQKQALDSRNIDDLLDIIRCHPIFKISIH